MGVIRGKMRSGSRRFSELEAAAVVAFVIAAALLTADSASAAFPGSNGRIAFVSERDGTEEIHSFVTAFGPQGGPYAEQRLTRLERG